MRSLLRLFMLLAACALAACSGTAEQGGPAPPPIGSTAGALPSVTPTVAAPDTAVGGTPGSGEPTPVLLTGAAGQHVTLQVGQELQIRLKDRRWSTPVADANSSILAVVPLNIQLPQRVSGWNYRAATPGETTLTSQGACLPAASGISCNSIILYKVTITVR